MVEEKVKKHDISLTLGDKEFKLLSYIMGSNTITFSNLRINEYENEPTYIRTDFSVGNERGNFKPNLLHLAYFKKEEVYVIQEMRFGNYHNPFYAEDIEPDEAIKIYINACYSGCGHYFMDNDNIESDDKRFIINKQLKVFMDFNVLARIVITGIAYEDENVTIYNFTTEEYTSEEISTLVNKHIDRFTETERKKLFREIIMLVKENSYRCIQFDTKYIDEFTDIVFNMHDKPETLIGYYVELIVSQNTSLLNNLSPFYKKVYSNIITKILKYKSDSTFSMFKVIEHLTNEFNETYSISSGLENFEKNYYIIEQLTKFLYTMGYFDKNLAKRIILNINEAKRIYETNIEHKTLLYFNTNKERILTNYLNTLAFFIWNKELSANNYRYLNKQVNRVNMHIQKLFLNNMHQYSYDKEEIYIPKGSNDLIKDLFKFHITRLNNFRALTTIVSHHKENMSPYAMDYLKENYMDDFVVSTSDSKRMANYTRVLLEAGRLITYYVDVVDKNLNYGYMHFPPLSKKSVQTDEIVKPYTEYDSVKKELKRFLLKSTLTK